MLKSEQILSVQFNDFSQSNLHPLKKYIATSPKAPILGPSQTLQHLFDVSWILSPRLVLSAIEFYGPVLFTQHYERVIHIIVCSTNIVIFIAVKYTNVCMCHNLFIFYVFIYCW